MNRIGLTILVIVFTAGAVFMFFRNQGAQHTLDVPATEIPSPTQAKTEAVDVATPTSIPTGSTSGLVRTIAEISLTVTSPQAGATVTNSRLTVTGKTSPKAEVYVNEAELFADSAGNFSATITLDEGENPVVVTAVDENGNMAEKDFVVTYNAGE